MFLVIAVAALTVALIIAVTLLRSAIKNNHYLVETHRASLADANDLRRLASDREQQIDNQLSQIRAMGLWMQEQDVAQPVLVYEDQDGKLISFDQNFVIREEP